MKEYFKQYRPFLHFLSVFLISYLLLILVYQWYLSQFDTSSFEVDSLSASVAQQAKFILEFLNYKVNLYPHLSDPSVVVAIDDNPIVRIVEGCNAASVMILFMAFVLAFSKGLFKTTAFIIFGILTIHILNIMRIALLTIGIIKYPKYEHILHGVVFPLVIYGTVFLLWILWVTKFTKDVAKST